MRLKTDKIMSRRKVVRLAAKLARYETFADYLELEKNATAQEIYAMTRIARMLGWQVCIRNGVIFEGKDEQGREKAIYIF